MDAERDAFLARVDVTAFGFIEDEGPPTTRDADGGGPKPLE